MDWIFFQCWWGKSAKAVRSSLVSSSMALTLGNWLPSMSATVSSWVRMAAVGRAKMVRMVAATISSAPFSITEKTLRTM